MRSSEDSSIGKVHAKSRGSLGEERCNGDEMSLGDGECLDLALDERETGLDFGRECWSSDEVECIRWSDGVLGGCRKVGPGSGCEIALSFSRRKDRKEVLFLGLCGEAVDAGCWFRDRTECMVMRVMVVMVVVRVNEGLRT